MAEQTHTKSKQDRAVVRELLEAIEDGNWRLAERIILAEQANIAEEKKPCA